MQNILFLDTETWPIRDGLAAPPLVCGSFALGPEVELLARDEALNTFREALATPDLLIGGHFVPFDMAVMCAEDPSLIPAVFDAYDAGRVRDTGVRQMLLDIATGRQQRNGQSWVFRKHRDGRTGGEWEKAFYSLADLGRIHLGKDRSAEKKDPSSWRQRFHELAGRPVSEYPPEASAYALEDVADTRDIYFSQGTDYIPDEIEQVRADFNLNLMRCFGLRTDGNRVAELERRIEHEHQVLRTKMIREGFYAEKRCTAEEVRNGKAEWWKPDSRGKTAPYKFAKNKKAIQSRVEAAFASLGKRPPMTAGGDTRPPEIATDRDTLNLTQDPVLAELGGGGPITTIRNTYLPVLKRGTETPINARFNVLLNTGRISCAEPNLLNPPRKGGVRECIKAPDGYDICSVDYDCAELRSHAQINVELFSLGRVEMAEFFRKDPHGDPHLELAASILKITPEEAKRRKKARDPDVVGIRQMAKALNFGLPGGMGVDRLIEAARVGYGVIMSREEAWERKQQWLRRWPEMQLYFEYMSGLVGSGTTSIHQPRPDGKPHRVRGGVGYTDGCNQLFQARTADGAKAALARVMRECYVDCGTALFGSRPMIFLYDEILAAVPKDVNHEAAYRLAEVMREEMQKWLPDIPVTCAPALMEFWSKEAEAVFDVNGRLIRWEPPPAVSTMQIAA